MYLKHRSRHYTHGRRPTRWRRLLLSGLCALIFICGLGLYIRGLTPSIASQQAKLRAQGVNIPSTTKPSVTAISNYHVSPTFPRYLNITALGIHARVQPVGLLKSDAIGTPNNVYDTAWYSGSGRPGQPGAMLIDGHVSSWTAHGIFYDLHNLKIGSTIQIERGDGKTYTYKVIRTQIYPAASVDMQAALSPVTTGKPGLNLITCDGTVDKGTSEFNKRLVVFASLE